MNSVTKNIIINAAKASNQNPEKTLALAGDLLSSDERERVRELLNTGQDLNWSNIDSLL